jgi:hypothetical protein
MTCAEVLTTRSSQLPSVCDSVILDDDLHDALKDLWGYLEESHSCR